MGSIKEFGLLGYHFLVQEEDLLLIERLVDVYPVRDIVKDHTEDIDPAKYLEVKKNSEFRTLTVYYRLDDFQFLISYKHLAPSEIWFGFYPNEELSNHGNLLSTLLTKSLICLCGFEIELTDGNENQILQELDELHPHAVIRQNSSPIFSGAPSKELDLVIQYTNILISLFEVNR